jgi:membrane-associated phospholipid phosphatase
VLDVVLFLVVTVDTVMLAGAALLFVGRARLTTLWRTLERRLRRRARPTLALAAVLVANGVLRDFVPSVSWVVGWNATSAIYRLEGDVVAQFQAATAPELTAYFAFTYVFGYVFLLSFPLVAYMALPDDRAYRETVVAYIINYVLGLVCYVLVVAYGPRNMIPEAVEPLLFSNYPGAHLLTAEVNTNTNVFPSLHTSLAVTVVLLARRTHDHYPAWTWVAAWVALSVVASTMHLGIHWATDVVAGAALAVGSVHVAGRVVDGPG